MTRYEGARAVVELMEMLESDEDMSNASAPEPEYRGGKPQRNVIREALAPILASGSPEALDGFCLTLTSIVALNASGFSVNAGDVARDVEAAQAESRFPAFLANLVQPAPLAGGE